jgi:transposase InsO family protein
MDLEKLANLGKQLGHEGESLKKFIDFERSREREERARQRDETRERLEAEREIVEKQLKLESMKKENAAEGHIGQSSRSCAPAPRLPEFKEGTDDMDAYLQRFERYADAQDWKKKSWGVNLSALLQGKGVSTYNRLSPIDANNYDILKPELLKAYHLTEDGFREKLRSAKPEQNESAQQFLARITDYLDRWIDLSETHRSFVGIVDLLLREQFISSCSKDMAIFIKERHPKDVKEMAIMASQYIDARGGWGLVSKSKPSNHKGQIVKKYTPSQTVKEGVEEKPVRKCFICDQTGHIAKYCRNRSKILKAAGLEMNDEMQQGKPKGAGKKKGCAKDKLCTACKCENCVNKDIGGNCMIIDTNVQDDSSGGFLTLPCGHKLPVMSAACSSRSVHKMPVTKGFVNGELVNVLRDSGCSSVVVRRSLVSPSEFTGELKTCVLIDGTVRRVPIAVINIDTPYFVGEVTALCMNNPVYDLIVGNIEEVRDPSNPNLNWNLNPIKVQNSDVTGAVETRHQKLVKEKELKELRVPAAVKAIVTVDVLRKAQEGDSTLDKFRELVLSGESKVTRNGGCSKFYLQKGILFREFQSPRVNFGEKLKQVVVPKQFRTQVMKLAHESILGGHQGVQRTTDKVTSNFFWPGVSADITRYCRSCDICQRTLPKGRVSKVPLGSMPVIETPFQRVAIDLVGPIHPCTERGKRYILTIVDYATRYPEAVPLRNIDTRSVAEALLDVYSRVGFPREVLSDNGAQFTSDVMTEVSRLLSIKQLTTTPYHPACNGLVERFNGTLKLMLKKLCEERPTDWDRYVNALLFAYRETPQATTGFSPFELLYGRSIRGPLAILKELWTDEVEESETKTTYQYVLDLQERLQSTCELARTELQKAQKRYKTYYNKGTKSRKFKVGDEVLLLLPTDNNKLLMHWKGPFTVIEKKSDMDYKINLGNKAKTFHANLLRIYYRRDQDEPSAGVTAGLFELACTSVIENEEDLEDMTTGCERSMSNDSLLQLPVFKQTETVSDVHVCSDLSDEQRRQVTQLLTEYRNQLSDVPGRSTLGFHDIKLTDSKPIRSRPYPVPHALRETIKKEVKTMLDLGVIEESESPYASPLCIVVKPDGTNRCCVDMRKLNQITVFDAEPTPIQDEIFSKLVNDNFFTKIDMSKGYWQVPMSEDAKPMTAFITHDGLYQFKVMPFGLVNSSASFSRLMRKLLRGIKCVDNYIDDILIHTPTWEEHIEKLAEVLERVRKANMTARPSKCYVGYDKVEFLGHVVGNGQLQPNPSKLEAIRDAPRPQTKTQLRSLLGLLNYYRSFIPNFAAIASPLTDKTRKGEPNRIKWDDSQELAFKTLKVKLTQSPILHLPDIDKQFILRTDASEVGIGAVLLQEFDGEKFPIAYASRKLNKAQRNYSVMEKESLAVVWGVQKFEPYLYGREFMLETDHQPLLCMQRSKVANGRIMRWALALQPYRYRMVAIKGKDNVGADYLSRSIE